MNRYWMWRDAPNLPRSGGFVLLAIVCSCACGAYAEAPVFSAPAPPSGVDAFPWPPEALTADESGNWVAAWCADPDGDDNSDVYYAHSSDDGASWSSPQRLNNEGETDVGDDRFVCVSVSDDTWIAVWDSIDNIGKFPPGWEEKDILFARSTDGGATWSPAAPLNGEADSDYIQGKNHIIDEKPCVASDGTGKWIAVWERKEMTPSVYTTWFTVASSCDDDGQTWTDEAIYAREWTSNSSESAFALAYGDSAWLLRICPTVGAAGEYTAEMSIYRSTNGIDWTPRQVIHTNTETPFSSFLNAGWWTDGAGTWLVYWDEDYGDDSTPNWEVTGCRSTNSGETWSPAARLLGPVNPERNQGFATMDSDGQGNLIALASEGYESGEPSERDFDLVVYTSSDAGATWSGPSVVDVDDGVARIKSVGNSNWVALWQQYPDGTPGQVVRATAVYPAGPPEPGVTVSPLYGLSTSEDGGTASFSVMLDAPPAAGETVSAAVVSEDPSEGTVTSGALLTFTAANWSDPAAHTVTITGADDTVVDGDVPYSVVIGPLASTDQSSPYHSMSVPPLTLLNMDNEQLTASVSAIHYLTAGGPKDDRNLWALIDIADELGDPVYGAYVSVDILFNGTVVLSDTQPTDGAGEAAFEVPKARSGTYTTVVQDVVKQGYLWDGITPLNEYVK